MKLIDLFNEISNDTKRGYSEQPKKFKLNEILAAETETLPMIVGGDDDKLNLVN